MSALQAKSSGEEPPASKSGPERTTDSAASDLPNGVVEFNPVEPGEAALTAAEG